jgi:uncharacterized membrane protein YcaP (DUF421 family)
VGRAVMWNDMWVMGIPVMEKLIRTLVVYFFIALALRLIGRRELAQFTAFDLVVVLLLSNVVQNAIIGPDNSLTGGLVGATFLFAANWLLVRLNVISDWTERLFEGTPTVIAEDGHLKPTPLRRWGLRPKDVTAAIRDKGAARVSDVQRAELMPSGTLFVDLKPEAQPATRGDVDRLMAKIAELEAAVAGGPGGKT